MCAANRVASWRRCHVAVPALLLLLVANAASASSSHTQRSLLGEPAAPCELHAPNKCSVSPLLVSSLPEPKTRSERLMAHYAALMYGCGQHKAEPDCISDRKNSCAFRRDEASGTPRCMVNPLAVVEHGAEALLCQKTKVLAVFRCMLAPRCSEDTWCSANDKGLCVPQFQKSLTEQALAEWEKDFHQGKPSAWGTCKGATLFRHLFKPCVKHQQRQCLEQPKCEWAPRGGGAGGLCTPKLWMLEPALMGQKDDDFAKGYWGALQVCRNAKAPDCAGSLTFTPNPEALAAFVSIDSVTATPELPLFHGTRNTTKPKHTHLNPKAGPKAPHPEHPRHRHKHHAHGPQAAPAAPGDGPTLRSEGRARDNETPTAGGIAVLVIASLVCMAIIGAAAYVAYNHIRNPKALYQPVQSADATEMAPTKLAAKQKADAEP